MLKKASTMADQTPPRTVWDALADAVFYAGCDGIARLMSNFYELPPIIARETVIGGLVLGGWWPRYNRLDEKAAWTKHWHRMDWENFTLCGPHDFLEWVDAHSRAVEVVRQRRLKEVTDGNLQTNQEH